MGNQSAESSEGPDPEQIVAVSHLEGNERKTGEQFGATEKITVNRKDVKTRPEREQGGRNTTPLDLERSVKLKTDIHRFVGTR